MTIFSQILKDGGAKGHLPGLTKTSRRWFRQTARDFAGSTSSGTVSARSRITQEGKKFSAPRIGSMYHFVYDPKGKKTLPYYDKFPLIFMVGPATNGFYGINLHYLPPSYRAALMDKLYQISSDRKFNEHTKLNLSYNVLKGASKFKYFKPTFKRYLAPHVRSRFLKIDSNEWDIALMLPTQNFAKATSGKVYSDSRGMI